MNPILNALNQSSPGVQSARQMYQLYRTAQNPTEYLSQIIRRNPVLAQIANSGNLQQTFYDLCRQRGVNPQDILNDIQR